METHPSLHKQKAQAPLPTRKQNREPSNKKPKKQKKQTDDEHGPRPRKRPRPTRTIPTTSDEPLMRGRVYGYLADALPCSLPPGIVRLVAMFCVTMECCCSKTKLMRLRAVFKSMRRFAERVYIECTPKGLYLQAMDQQCINLAELSLDASAWDSYYCAVPQFGDTFDSDCLRTLVEASDSRVDRVFCTWMSGGAWVMSKGSSRSSVTCQSVSYPLGDEQDTHGFMPDVGCRLSACCRIREIKSHWAAKALPTQSLVRLTFCPIKDRLRFAFDNHVQLNLPLERTQTQVLVSAMTRNVTTHKFGILSKLLHTWVFPLAQLGESVQWSLAVSDAAPLRLLQDLPKLGRSSRLVLHTAPRLDDNNDDNNDDALTLAANADAVVL